MSAMASSVASKRVPLVCALEKLLAASSAPGAAPPPSGRWLLQAVCVNITPAHSSAVTSGASPTRTVSASTRTGAAAGTTPSPACPQVVVLFAP
jgi:hypothetical protein